MTRIASLLLVAALASVASAQTLLQLLTSPVPAGKPYNLTTLQSLLSPAVLGNDTFNSYVAALGGGSNLTVFAPTDNAFNATITALGGLSATLPLVPEILSYHISTTVVSSAYLAENKASFIPTLLGNSSLSHIKPQVVEVEVTSKGVVLYSAIGVVSNVIDTIVGSNGVIHVVDAVLIPPFNVSTTVGIANAANQSGVTFRSLTDALIATDLLTTVDTATPITIFAPVDSAFAAISAALTPAQLNFYLKTVLTYHVIGGAAAYFPPSGTYTTLAGEDVTVVSNATSLEVTVNGNPVLETVLVTNGVIHIIGKVLVPPTVAKALEPSPDYRCGKDIGTCPSGFCCSMFNWCGNSPAHCMSGACQPVYSSTCQPVATGPVQHP